MANHKELIRQVREQLGVGYTVADELLVLAGDDIEMVVTCSKASPGLDQCKAAIIDSRLRIIEDALFED